MLINLLFGYLTDGGKDWYTEFETKICYIGTKGWESENEWLIISFSTIIDLHKILIDCSFAWCNYCYLEKPNQQICIKHDETILGMQR